MTTLPAWEREMLRAPWPDRPADELHPGLWVGGCRYGDPERDAFGFVLTLIPRGEHPSSARVARRMARFPLVDKSHGLPDPGDLDHLVAEVVDSVRAGERTLVRCYAGLNRSALVGCLALCELTGMGGDEAVARIREVRSPTCLINPAFRARVELVAAQPRGATT
jgi:hypothetical protein